MKHQEAQLQTACVRWFRLQFSRYSQLLFHIPNGGSRNIIEAKRFKEMGVVAGIPDLFLSVAKKGFHGLYIEMKSDRGRLNDNQKEIHILLRNQGFAVEVCNNFDDFVRIIFEYLGD